MTYCCSLIAPWGQKASSELQEALGQSGFKVTRMNTYNTSGIKRVAPELLKAALGAQIVTFGSPSAVKAWVDLVGMQVR